MTVSVRVRPQIKEEKLDTRNDNGAVQVGFAWEPSVSARGTAAVVDGCCLMLTPLRLSVLPPPLCSLQAVLPSPISLLAFCDHGPSEVPPTPFTPSPLHLIRSF